MRIAYDELFQTMKDRLLKYGAPEDVADGCARNLADTSRSGVYSHGLNRFPRIIAMMQKGVIRPEQKPTRVHAQGGLEVWDGNLGMGNTNAAFCMGRAVELARTYGLGCVAERHTNHWQRGGAFGIQAAQAGCVGICWTTTQPNMPAWGAKDRRIGNNPLVFCVPAGDSYVLVDAAMAQFSYGALESARLAGKLLPVEGGYDEEGNLTRDPAAIEKTWRVLPMGFWKGSGLALLLDMMAAVLSGGKAIHEIGRQGPTPLDEYNITQVFIAISLPQGVTREGAVQGIIDDLKASALAEGVGEIRYPSEREREAWEENGRLGIPVNDTIWQTVCAL